jgi:hypothetical protein
LQGISAEDIAIWWVMDSQENKPQKKIRKRFRNACEWEIDEIIGYQLPSGAFACSA